MIRGGPTRQPVDIRFSSPRAPASGRSPDRGETEEVPGGERGGAGGAERGGEEGGAAQGHHRAGEAASAQRTRLQAAGIPAQGRDDLMQEFTLTVGTFFMYINNA